MPAADQADQNGATIGMGGIAAPDRTEDTTALITEQCYTAAAQCNVHTITVSIAVDRGVVREPELALV